MRGESEYVLSANRGVFDALNGRAGSLDGFVADVKNVLPGTMRQRSGVTLADYINAPSGPILGLHSYASGALSNILVAFGTSVARVGGASGEYGLSSQKHVAFVSHVDGKVYYVNGVNGLRSFDGTTTFGAVTVYTPSASESPNRLADGADAIQTCKVVESHDGVLYMANTVSEPSRVYRCDEVQGPTYWRHYADLPSAGGGKVRALRSFNGVLVVLKSDSIMAIDGLVGDSSIRVRTLHASVGCANHSAVTVIPGFGMVFLGSDKQFYLLKPEDVLGENIRLWKLSGHINNITRKIDPAQFDSETNYPVAGHYDKYYLCTYKNIDATNFTTMVADFTKSEVVNPIANEIFIPWSVYASNAFPTYLNIRAHARHTDQFGTTGLLSGTTIYTGISGGITNPAFYMAITPHGGVEDGFLYAPDAATTMLAIAPIDYPVFSLVTNRIELRETANQRSRADINRYKSISSIHVVYKQTTTSVVVAPSISVEDGDYVALDTFDCTGGERDENFEQWKLRKISEVTIPVNQRGRWFRLKFESTPDAATDYVVEILEIRIRYTEHDYR